MSIDSLRADPARHRGVLTRVACNPTAHGGSAAQKAMTSKILSRMLAFKGSMTGTGESVHVLAEAD